MWYEEARSCGVEMKQGRPAFISFQTPVKRDINGMRSATHLGVMSPGHAHL